VPHDWDAASYDEVSVPQTRWGGAVASWLELGGGECVLDAGCGTGRVTEAVLARLPRGQVIALDGSAAMVATARSRLAGAALSEAPADAHRGLAERTGAPSEAPADAHRGLAERTGASHVAPLVADLRGPLPIAPGSLDGVISTATFHWLPDHDALFRELVRVLRPGGQLVVQCGGRGNLGSVRGMLAETGDGAWRGPWNYANAEATSARLEAAGFSGVRCWLNDEQTTFGSREALGVFLRTVVLWPYLERLPEAEHESFVERVLDRLPDLVLDYVRLNMVARRPS